MQFVETHHTLQASFPIKVQVTIQGCKVDGWMDDRLVKELHDSLHSTQPARLHLPNANHANRQRPYFFAFHAGWPPGRWVVQFRLHSVRSIPPYCSPACSIRAAFEVHIRGAFHFFRSTMHPPSQAPYYCIVDAWMASSRCWTSPSHHHGL